MIDNLAQPQMFGGARPRKYVLPGGTDYSESPATLAVGSFEQPPYNYHGGAYDSDSESDEEEYRGGKKYKVKTFVKDVSDLGKLIPKSTREAMTQKANQEIMGAGVKRRGRPPKRLTPQEWLDGGALTSAGMHGYENMPYPKGLESYKGEFKGGKKYKVKTFVNDVKSLGSLIPKSTREAITQKANQEIMGAGISGGKKYKVKTFVNDVKSLGSLIPKSTREAITAKANQEISGAGRPVSERGKIVKKVMQEMGLSLGQASKYVKEKGLY
jgi:hypothetical protein